MKIDVIKTILKLARKMDGFYKAKKILKAKELNSTITRF